MIYLDYAAATPVSGDVVGKMLPYLTKRYGNPSSLHFMGQEACLAVEGARVRVARVLGCGPAEVVFTGSGTQSINLALVGVCRAMRARGNHIITTKIEHKAVLETCRFLEREGFSVTYLDVDSSGRVSAEAVQRAITIQTILVSVMFVNNEVGSIQPLFEIAQVTRRKKILLHTDACQAGTILDVTPAHLGVDLLSLNAAKLYGPKGVGLLYVREGVLLEPLILGGGQERGLVSGTENVAGVVGFSYALKECFVRRRNVTVRLVKLKSYFWNEIKRLIPDCVVLGSQEGGAAHILSIAFKEVEAQQALLLLNEQGVCVSSGSACQLQKIAVSHVLEAMRVPSEYLLGVLRFSFGTTTTKKELVKTVTILKQVISSLRTAMA